MILRPCQWMGVPVGKGEKLSDFVALPKDGLPVTSWPNPDAAFKDAVGAIRTMLRQPQPAPGAAKAGSAAAAPATALSPMAGRTAGVAAALHLPPKPTDLDRDRFLREGFRVTAALFERNLAELKASDNRVDTDFERIDNRSFAASAYVDGKRVGQVSIWHGGDMWRNALCLSYDAATSSPNSMND